MTEVSLPVARGYASWDPRGFYHYHERPGGAFISGQRYLDLLRPSIAGYHGWAGRTQPYAAIAQILGPGIPSAAHKWWRAIEAIPTPTTDIPPRGARQYMYELTVIDAEGNVSTDRQFIPIGTGYDVSMVEERIHDYLTTGTGSPPRDVDEEEPLEEIGREVTQIDWEWTPGITLWD